MPSPINTPTPTVTTATDVVSTTEIVAGTSAGVTVDVPQYAVVVRASIDFLNSSSGTTATIKLRRGTTISGTLITTGNTWGPFTLAASDRYNFSVIGIDEPAACAGQTYVATLTIAGNSGTPVIETCVMEVSSGSFT